jgi:hypothetical protein
MATVARVLSGLLALNRTAFGITYLARPQQAGKSWIGGVARAPGTKVMVRSQGARDVALGAGALWALARRRDDEARAWMAAHALADGADTVVTWTARRRLPKRGVRTALTMASASTAVAVIGAAGLRARPPTAS